MSILPPNSEEPQAENPFRRLPAVHQLADAAERTEWGRRSSRDQLTAAARLAIEECRQAIAEGQSQTLHAEHLVQRLHHWLLNSRRPALPEVINGTGVLLHTGLGRAPLAPQALQAIEEAARGYTALEIDLETGERGARADAVRDALRQLTGAEEATVVNNNAASLLLALNTLASGREVIVSRGELIEIGGSFRLPEIMAASGAILVEVGTTNKTRLADYAHAIGERTGLILKVHHSNFHISGFAESVAIDPLVKLGREHSVPVVHDIGSGALFDWPEVRQTCEPVVRQSVEAGADLVLFSGDKLLGGPQAGIIVGEAGAVRSMERNPLARALRCDKLALAALSATLALAGSAKDGIRSVPLWRLASVSCAELRARAERIAAAVAERVPGVTMEVTDTTAYLGGGAVPGHGLESVALVVQHPGCSEEQLARRLRCGSHPVVGRLERRAVYLDLRAIFPHQDERLVSALVAALHDLP